MQVVFRKGEVHSSNRREFEIAMAAALLLPQNFDTSCAYDFRKITVKEDTTVEVVSEYGGNTLPIVEIL